MIGHQSIAYTTMTPLSLYLLSSIINRLKHLLTQHFNHDNIPQAKLSTSIAHKLNGSIPF